MHAIDNYLKLKLSGTPLPYPQTHATHLWHIYNDVKQEYVVLKKRIMFVQIYT